MTLTAEDIRHCRAIAIAGHERVRQIIAEVARESGVSRERIVGPQRSKDADRARQIVMFVASREGIHDTIIGRALNRDRSTVAKGAREEERRRAADQEAAE